jgi:hypothetical protein
MQTGAVLFQLCVFSEATFQKWFAYIYIYMYIYIYIYIYIYNASPNHYFMAFIIADLQGNHLSALTLYILTNHHFMVSVPSFETHRETISKSDFLHNSTQSQFQSLRVMIGDLQGNHFPKVVPLHVVCNPCFMTLGSHWHPALDLEIFTSRTLDCQML